MTIYQITLRDRETQTVVPIPGNDDAMRAIHLYCDLVAGSVLDGLQAELAASGVDIGARADLAERAIPAEISESPAAEVPEEAEPEGIESEPDAETVSAVAN